jgi:hypothetical protein
MQVRLTCPSTLGNDPCSPPRGPGGSHCGEGRDAIPRRRRDVGSVMEYPCCSHPHWADPATERASTTGAPPWVNANISTSVESLPNQTRSRPAGPSCTTRWPGPMAPPG